MRCIRPAVNWIGVASSVLCPLVWGKQAAEVKPIILANDKLEFTISPMGAKDTNPPDDYIANLEQVAGGKLIKLSAESNGKFTLTNTCNGFTKSCAARP